MRIDRVRLGIQRGGKVYPVGWLGIRPKVYLTGVSYEIVDSQGKPRKVMLGTSRAIYKKLRRPYAQKAGTSPRRMSKIAQRMAGVRHD